LLDLAERPVNRLSGGEKVRVMLARALATGAPLQLWDEPLAQLDPRHVLDVLILMQNFTREGNTLLFSLHDLRIAHCLDEVVVLHEGALRAAGAPAEVLTPELLHAVFGVRVRTAEGIILELP
jgi:ABC-type cobalamin/Fe3+-siderophores transport system ATPase subunit